MKQFGKEHVFLHAKQKAVFCKKYIESTDKQSSIVYTPLTSNEHLTKTLISDKVDVAAVISWKEKNWVIEREDLESLAIKIERRYNVQIHFADESLKKFIFSGVLKDESLEQILTALQLSAPVKYTIDQNSVTFYNQYSPKNSTNSRMPMKQ